MHGGIVSSRLKGSAFMGLLDWLITPKQLTREAFVQEASELLARAGVTNFTYDAERFALRSVDHTWFLENAFARTRQLSRRKREKELEKFVATVIEAPTIDVSTLDAVAPLLKPTVRLHGRDVLSQLQRAVDGGDAAMAIPYAFEPLADELIMRPVVDTPSSIMHVDARQLAQWGISADNALKIALANVRHQVVPPGFTRVQAGVFAGTWVPDYQPSTMLFPEVFRGLALQGAPVVAPLTRETIYVTGSEDVAGLTQLLTFAEQALSQDVYQCSSSLYRHDGKSWSKFMPSLTPDIERLARRVDMLQSWHLYELQKQLLEKLQEKDRFDAFIASFLVVEQAPALFSVSSWAHDIDSLLPRTDVIAMQLSQGGTRMLHWRDAVGAFGELMPEEPDLVPTRWRVRRSPSDDQIMSIPVFES